MHLAASAPASSAALFALLLSVSPALTSAAQSAQSVCIRQRSDEFAHTASCGDKGSLLRCFKRAPDAVLRSDIERCFLDAGCSADAAPLEANLLVESCDDFNPDLRKRGLDAMPLITEAPVLRFKRAADAGQTAMSGSDCSSETQVESKACSTVNNEATCEATMVPSQVCKSEYVCKESEDNGQTMCMVRQDGLTTDGAIVTAILAVALAGGIGFIIYLCCQDKSRQKKAMQKKEAESIAKSAAAPAAPAPPPAQRQPSMARSASASSYGGAPQDPFHDSGSRAPQL